MQVQLLNIFQQTCLNDYYRIKVPDSRAQQGERRERKVYVGYHNESLTQVRLLPSSTLYLINFH